jgi:RNA polymerase subunit RPABC4/transcription elongation factor Spt4
VRKSVSPAGADLVAAEQSIGGHFPTGWNFGKGSQMKTLNIRWQRLLTEEQTCPRCGSTEAEVEKAAAILKQSLAPLGIEVVLGKGELSVEEFKQATLLSNMIWLDGRLLEEWLGATTGQSECCDVCGPNDCRTVEVQGAVYETVTADLIVKAGLLAAAQLVDRQICDCSAAAIWPGGGCCPK